MSLIFAVFATACEKSDQVVLQEQLQEGNIGCPAGCPEPKAGCTIKGNISGQGRRFFILEGDKRYSLAIVEPAKGEAFFCTPQEAQQNGFEPVPPGI